MGLASDRCAPGDAVAVDTPLYDHVYSYPDVYEPAEDTFLLLDALEKDIARIREINPKVVLEVGSGSGVVTAFVAKIIGHTAHYVCTDKNPSACLCTAETARKNGVLISSVVTSFVDGLLPRLVDSVDVLIFNPPYVVTPSEEIKHGGIAYAWAGGVNGREVMDEFFPIVPRILSAKGSFYLVVIKENGPDTILQELLKYGLRGEVVLTRKAGMELLSILKFKPVASLPGT